ncbi:MAG: 8-oxo-dGTP pyrophosphatase MutT (NUDIX family) [Kiritimatiellia bacterium]|jgi:8-oxo-dGTP pyrophosphatase MutT (NUDIX family)
MSVPAPASTIIVLRPSGSRFAVFMVERHRKSGFMPSAWVFPGGRVDGADSLHAHERVNGGAVCAEQMGLSREDAVPYLVAGVRETYEEAGIWLGAGVPGADVRDALNGGRATMADVLEDPRLAIDLDRLKPWSWWVTPTVERRRYDTRFLVACVQSAEGRHDDHETVDSAWIDIDEVVRRAESGDLYMAPPTWWTLRELAALPDLDAVQACDRPADRVIEPILEVAGAELTLCLPGHADHGEPAIAGLPPSLGFSHGRWWHGG